MNLIKTLLTLPIALAFLAIPLITSANEAYDKVLLIEDELTNGEKALEEYLLQEIQNIDSEIDHLVRLLVVGSDESYPDSLNNSLINILIMSPQCLLYNNKDSFVFTKKNSLADTSYKSGLSLHSSKVIGATESKSSLLETPPSLETQKSVLKKLIAFYKSCQTMAHFHISMITKKGQFSKSELEALTNYQLAVNDGKYIPVEIEKAKPVRVLVSKVGEMSGVSELLESGIQLFKDKVLDSDLAEAIGDLKPVRYLDNQRKDMVEGVKSSKLVRYLKDEHNRKKSFVEFGNMKKQLSPKTQIYVEKMSQLSNAYSSLSDALAELFYEVKLEDAYGQNRVSN